jgi:hypothetical protein
VALGQHLGSYNKINGPVLDTFQQRKYAALFSGGILIYPCQSGIGKHGLEHGFNFFRTKSKILNLLSFAFRAIG